jgi:hypothetical protein
MIIKGTGKVHWEALFQFAGKGGKQEQEQAT